MIMIAVLWFLAQYATGHTRVLGDVGLHVFNLFSKIIQGGKSSFYCACNFCKLWTFFKIETTKKG